MMFPVSSTHKYKTIVLRVEEDSGNRCDVLVFDYVNDMAGVSWESGAAYTLREP